MTQRTGWLRPRGWMLCVLVTLLGACALPQRGEYHGTRISISSYSKARIGLLPLALNPRTDDRDLPRAKVEETVTRALQDALSIDAIPVPADQIPKGRGEFPLTAVRLAALSRELGYDGLVGISVSSWWVNTEVCQGCPAEGHLDLMLSFADGNDPRGEWTLTSNWRGPLGDRSVGDMHSRLSLLLMDLRLALGRHPIAAFLSERHQENQPQLTYVSPEAERSRPRGGVTDRKFVDLQVTGIDDAGLSSMSIVNEHAKFKWELPGIENDVGERPIYLASKVRVPLLKGRNLIELQAAPAKTGRVPARRELILTTSADHEFFVAAIGTDTPASRDSAATAATRLALSSESQSGARLRPLTNDRANRAAVAELLEEAGRKLSVGDSVLVSLSGRVVPIGAGLFVDLSGGTADLSGDESVLQLEELLRPLHPSERVVALDLCTEPDSMARVHRYLRTAIPPSQMAVVRVSDCSVPLGTLADAAADVLDRQTRLRAESYRGRTFFSDFLAALADTSRVAYLRSSWTDMVFSGDGTPAISQDWASAPRSPGWLSSIGFAGSPYVKAEAAADTAEFHLIAFTTPVLNAAREEVRRLNALGTQADIVQSSSGVYGVSIARAKDVEQAMELLMRARVRSAEPAQYFLMPRSRVLTVVP